MAEMTQRLVRLVFGTSDAQRAGRTRALRGLREGDNRDLYLGLALSAIAYLQRTKPRKQLIYRQKVPEGTALVIHHRKTGSPRLEIVKPKRRG